MSIIQLLLSTSILVTTDMPNDHVSCLLVHLWLLFLCFVIGHTLTLSFSPSDLAKPHATIPGNVTFQEYLQSKPTYFGYEM